MDNDTREIVRAVGLDAHGVGAVFVDEFVDATKRELAFATCGIDADLKIDRLITDAVAGLSDLRAWNCFVTCRGWAWSEDGIPLRSIARMALTNVLAAVAGELRRGYTDVIASPASPLY